jgi:hypothetical protein
MKEKNGDEVRRQERNDFSLNSNGHVHYINTWFKGTSPTDKVSLILRAPSLKYTTLFRRTSGRILRTLTNSTLLQTPGSATEKCSHFSLYFFLFCWPCLSLQIIANKQLDALFHVFIYLISLRVSSITVLIIRRSNCINTSSGMISVSKWLLGMPVRTGIPSSHTH